MFRPHCTYCNHVNPPASKYCTRCGVELFLTACPSCNALNDPTARACHNCTVTLRQGDVGVLTRPPLTTGAPRKPDDSVIANRINDSMRPALSASTRLKVASDLAKTDAVDAVSEGWAGSSPITFARSRGRPNVSKIAFTHRWKPILIALAIADIAGFSWYGYRYAYMAEQRAQSGDETERESRSRTANYQIAIPVSAKDETNKPEGDSGPRCTEAVAALALCSSELTQRKD